MKYACAYSFQFIFLFLSLRPYMGLYSFQGIHLFWCIQTYNHIFLQGRSFRELLSTHRRQYWYEIPMMLFMDFQNPITAYFNSCHQLDSLYSKTYFVKFIYVRIGLYQDLLNHRFLPPMISMMTHNYPNIRFKIFTQRFLIQPQLHVSFDPI